mmetsp:Transcript_114837/g.335876  ORF Transcript_114837/g.335876 Transcript_114837/m.335876 type:complete len:784 (-) Transcript_114837:81-2432(-)
MTSDFWRPSDVIADGTLGLLYITIDASLNSAHQTVLGRNGLPFPAMHVSSHTFFNMMFLAPALVLTPSCRKWHLPLCNGNWTALFIFALISVTRIVLEVHSLVHVELSMSQAIRAALPLFVALIQSVCGAPLPLHQLGRLVAISLGATMVAYQPSAFLSSGCWDVFLVTLSVTLQASQIYVAARLLSTTCDAWRVMLCTAPITFLISLGPAVLLEGQRFRRSVDDSPWIAILALAGTSLLTAVHSFVMLQAIRRLGAVGTAMLGSAKVVLLVLSSLLLMDGAVRWSLVQGVGLGCLLVLGGAAANSMLTLPSAGADSRRSGPCCVWWKDHSRLHTLAASLGFSLVSVLCVFVLFGQWPASEQAECLSASGSQAQWTANGREQALNGHRARLDPCHNLTVPEGLGQPSRATVAGELVLVTGGSGFIGSHLVTQLLELGYRVRVFDNLETGNLLFLDLTAPGLEFHYGDILDADALRAAMVGVRGVFHLGAASKVLPSLKDPSMATFNYERNAVGTSRVLEVANETGQVRKVLFAASSTYYGNQPAPFAETDPFMPTSPYAASKYMGELEMLTHDSLYHLPTLSLRFFMVYGPRNPAHGAYAIVTGKFIARLQEGQPLILEGSGKNYRDFVHVHDVARALILGYQSTVHGTVINVGTGKAYSVQEVADLVSSNQVRVAARPNDLLGTLADTCRAKHVLNFEARYDFMETMHQMIADAKAGRAEYLSDMWEDPHVVEALEGRLPGWSGLGSSRERSAAVREALAGDRRLLEGLLADIRAKQLRHRR